MKSLNLKCKSKDKKDKDKKIINIDLNDYNTKLEGSQTSIMRKHNDLAGSTENKAECVMGFNGEQQVSGTLQTKAWHVTRAAVTMKIKLNNEMKSNKNK